MEVDPSNNDNIPLLTMSLELDNGLTEQINIYRNSDPETLAFEFCKEHNLELDSVNYLKEQIQKLLNETKEAEDEEVEDEMEEEQIEEVYEDEGTEDNRYEGKGQEKGSDDIKRREEEIHQLTENNQIDDDIEIGEEEDEEGGEGEDEGEVKGENDVNEVNDNDNDIGEGGNNNNGTIPENPEDEKDVQEEVNVVNKDNNDKDNETPLKIEDLLHTGKNEYKQHLGNDNVHDKEDVNEPLTNEIIEDHHHHHQQEEEEEQEQEQEEQWDVIKEHDEDTNSFHKDNIEIQEIQDLEDNNDEQYNDDNDNDNDNDNDDTNNNIHNFKENQPKELEDEDYDNINEDNILHNNNNHNPSLPPSNTNIIIDEPKQPSSKDNNNIHNLPDHPSPPQQNQPQDSLENTEQDDELPISQDNNNNNNNYHAQPYRHHHHHHIDEDEDDNDVQMVHHTQPLHHQMEDNIHSGNSNNNNTHHTASNTVKNNNNIFNRLFQDAEIKRVMPKRPCHFNNRNNNNNNNNTNNSGANNNSSANTNNTNNTKPKKQTTTTTNNNNNVVVVTNNPTNTNNYGEYLYEQHKLHKQEQLHRNEEDKRESQNKELTHCTFKPNINNTNNNAFTSSNNNNSNINNYNYYYNGKQVQTIGTNNTSIRPRTPMTRAEKLEKEFNEKHTFKPQINSGYTTELNFLERQALHMQKCKDNIENYKQMLHQQQQQQYDNAQQQRKCHSKPRTPCYTANNACCVVGGGEYNSTTFANTNVFDRNYNYANQYKKKLIELTNMYNNNNNNSKTNPNMTNTQFNVNNNKIIDRVNCEAFSNLFKVLDSDEDGVISQMHMNTKKLSPEVYRIIEPIINEIKEENQKLEESDFVDAMCNLYEDIRYYDRHLLINTFKNIKNTKIKQHITNNNNTCSFNHNYKTNNNTKKGINIDHQRKDGRMLLYKNEDKKYNTNYTFKPVINANAHKYAKRYDEKQQQMYNKYLSLYNSSSSNKFNSNREKGGYINRAEYFKDNSNNSNNNNMNFNSLRNCTFDNYVKNLH